MNWTPTFEPTIRVVRRNGLIVVLPLAERGNPLPVVPVETPGAES